MQQASAALEPPDWYSEGLSGRANTTLIRAKKGFFEYCVYYSMGPLVWPWFCSISWNPLEYMGDSATIRPHLKGVGVRLSQHNANEKQINPSFWSFWSWNVCLYVYLSNISVWLLVCWSTQYFQRWRSRLIVMRLHLWCVLYATKALHKGPQGQKNTFIISNYGAMTLSGDNFSWYLI